MDSPARRRKRTPRIPRRKQIRRQAKAQRRLGVDIWREKAAEFLPEYMEQITSAESPMMLWTEISFELEKAYKVGSASNNFVAIVYRFAFWRINQSQID